MHMNHTIMYKSARYLLTNDKSSTALSTNVAQHYYSGIITFPAAYSGYLKATGPFASFKTKSQLLPAIMVVHRCCQYCAVIILTWHSWGCSWCRRLHCCCCEALTLTTCEWWLLPVLLTQRCCRCRICSDSLVIITTVVKSTTLRWL